jgi:ubiquitin-activating enzyme E1
MGMDNLADKLRHDLGQDSALETARELAEDLLFINDIEGDYSTALIAKSIEWAVGLAKHLYFDAIEALLIEHPIDSVDDDGEPFWSGSRKMPKSVMYVSSGENNPQREAINQNLINFIRAAARLRYETYFGIPSNPRTNACLVNEQMALHALQESAAKSSDDDTVKNTDGSEGKAEDPSIKDTISALDAYRGSPTELHSAEFEKDDDSNDHVAFITAASNLRAICYGIPPVDALETRKIAGKIIPAMITTTAFVSAVSCLELVKLVQPNVLLKRYRNAFINLALPFFAFTPPLPAERIRGWKGTTHTLWDRIDIKEGKKSSEKGGITLRKLLSKIQKKVDKESPGSVQISTISVGPLMIYANFLNEDDHELLDNNIWDIVSDAAISGAEFDQRFSRDSNDENKEDSDDAGPDQSTVVPSYDGSNKEFLDFSVVVEDTETCEEIELPPIRIHRYVMKRE